MASTPSSPTRTSRAAGCRSGSTSYPRPTSGSISPFSWDEGVGIRLFVDGREVARKDGRANLDAGLDQFGLAGRIISPHQVQSRYHFMRGSDVDEIRVYDHMLGADRCGGAGRQS